MISKESYTKKLQQIVNLTHVVAESVEDEQLKYKITDLVEQITLLITAVHNEVVDIYNDKTRPRT